MRRQILILMVVLFSGNVAFGQDPVFSQYYAAPLQLNPAFAGTGYAPQIALNYRNQWPTLNAYVTYSASYDQYIDHLNSGFGLMVQTDDAGEGLIKTNKVAGFFSYRLQINKEWFVKLGAEVAWVQGRYNWAAFMFGDQLSKTTGPISAGGTPFPTNEITPENLNNTYGDVSAGMLVYNKTFYGGLSIKHINRPNESIILTNQNLFTGLPYRFSVHAGAQIQLIEGNKRKPAAFISPNIMFVRQGDFGQTNVGANLGYGSFFVGGWYRHAKANPDAVIAVVGVEQGIFKIGYSYDFTVSQLNNSGGSHEISLRIKPREPKQDFNDCFQLFR